MTSSVGSPQPRRYDHRAAPGPDDHHADAVRSRHHRKELRSGRTGARRISRKAPLLRRRRAGRSDTSGCYVRSEHEFVLCRGRKAAGEHLEPSAPGSAADRRRSWMRDPACGRHHAVSHARSAAAPRLRIELEDLATTDPLTGLEEPAQIDHRNRSGVAAGAAQSKTPVAVLMIDADHFKAYNDTYGAPVPAIRCWSASRSGIWTRCKGAGDCPSSATASEEFLPRGILAGALRGRCVRRRRDHPAEGRTMGGISSATTSCGRGEHDEQRH